METTIVYRGYMGIMENEMETTIIKGVLTLTPFLSSHSPLLRFRV